MSIKISQMNPSPSAALSDEYEINKSGVTYQQTLTQVKTLYNNYFLQITNKLSELSSAANAATANQNLGNLGPSEDPISIPADDTYEASVPLSQFFEVSFGNTNSKFQVPAANVVYSPSAYNSGKSILVNTGSVVGQVVDRATPTPNVIAYVNPGEAIQFWNNDNSSAAGDWEAYPYATDTYDLLYITDALTFLGSGRRILGDLTNATHANRLLFRSSTTNGASYLGMIPNGLATWSSFNVYSSSDPDNAHLLQLYADGSGNTVGLNSVKTGSGTVRPIWLLWDSTPVIKITSATSIEIPDATIANGKRLKTGTTAGNSYSFSAYGTGSSSYKDFITFTCDGPTGGVPECNIYAPAGGILTIDGAVIGGITPEIGKFTTLTANTKVVTDQIDLKTPGADFLLPHGVEITDDATNTIECVNVLASGNVATVLVKHPVPSDTLLIQNGNGPIDANGLFIDEDGVTTNANQPAFLVRNSTNRPNETGDGTSYHLIFNTEIEDQGGVFDGASTFTCPASGLCQLEGIVGLYGVDSGHTFYTIIVATSNRGYEIVGNAYLMSDGLGNSLLPFNIKAQMDAGDTASVYIIVSNGTKTVGVLGAEILTWFGGHLIC